MSTIQPYQCSCGQWVWSYQNHACLNFQPPHIINIQYPQIELMDQIKEIQEQMKTAELEAKLSKLEARLRKLEGPTTGTTHIGVVQDKSISMSGREQATITGFNEYVQTLRKGAKEDEVEYRLTLTQFDTEYTVLYEDTPLAKVKDLTDKDYRPGGSTALFDAIGRTITAIENQMGPDDDALILVMTDGQENSSREITTREQLQRIIKKKEATDRWTFVYMGADQDAFAAGTNLGFRGGNTFSHSNDHGGITSTYSSLASATHLRKVSNDVTSAVNFVQDYMEADKKDDDDGEV
jgi:hypothetical protein